MDSRRALRPYRGNLAVSGSTLALVVLLFIAVWWLGLGSHPLARALTEASLPLSLVAGLIFVLAVAALAVHVSLTPPLAAVTAEEPLLSPPRVPAIRRGAPFIVVLGIQPQSGASTLACGLAFLAATQGRLVREPGRRPRPLCLLKSNDVPSGIGLDSQALESYLRAHPSGVEDDILDLAGRHPEGIEFLALGRERPSASQLHQLLPVLRDHYDAIIMDSPAEDRWMAATSAELADAIFLVWAPDDDEETLQRWVERLWGLGLEGKTIMTANRRRAGDRPLPRSVFQFSLEVPEDSAVRERGGQDMAWAVGDSSAARQLRQAAHSLLPQLLPQGDDR